MTYTRTNDRGSTLTSGPSKGAVARYRACAVDRRALTLSMRSPPQQPQGPAVGQQTARVFCVRIGAGASGSCHGEHPRQQLTDDGRVHYSAGDFGNILAR